MPRLDTITGRLARTGFVQVVTERHLRSARLVLANEERSLRVEARAGYRFLTTAELDDGVRRMRADAARGDWIDPRPTCIIVAARPQSERVATP
jgi:hypothetical protein